MIPDVDSIHKSSMVWVSWNVNDGAVGLFGELCGCTVGVNVLSTEEGICGACGCADGATRITGADDGEISGAVVGGTGSTGATGVGAGETEITGASVGARTTGLGVGETVLRTSRVGCRLGTDTGLGMSVGGALVTKRERRFVSPLASKPKGLRSYSVAVTTKLPVSLNSGTGWKSPFSSRQFRHAHPVGCP